MESMERANSMVMKNGGLSVAQPSIDMTEDKVCGATSKECCEVYRLYSIWKQMCVRYGSG